MRALPCLGILAVAIFAPHAANAALSCNEYQRDRFTCLEDTVTDVYSWTLGSGGQGELTVQPNTPFMANFVCSNVNDPPATVNGQYIADQFTATIQVWMLHITAPAYPNGRTDTANPLCTSVSPAAYLALLDDWYQWEFNVTYFWALITGGGQGGATQPNFCWMWGTPFTCIDGTDWDGYGVTMFMMNWYNTYFW